MDPAIDDDLALISNRRRIYETSLSSRNYRTLSSSSIVLSIFGPTSPQRDLLIDNCLRAIFLIFLPDIAAFYTLDH